MLLTPCGRIRDPADLGWLSAGPSDLHADERLFPALPPWSASSPCWSVTRARSVWRTSACAGWLREPRENEAPPTDRVTQVAPVSAPDLGRPVIRVTLGRRPAALMYEAAHLPGTLAAVAIATLTMAVSARRRRAFTLSAATAPNQDPAKVGLTRTSFVQAVSAILASWRSARIQHRHDPRHLRGDAALTTVLAARRLDQRSALLAAPSRPSRIPC